MKNEEKQIEPPTEDEILDILRSYNPDAFEWPEPDSYTINTVSTIERKSNTSFFIKVRCGIFDIESRFGEEMEVIDELDFDMLYEYINGRWEIQSYDVN